MNEIFENILAAILFDASIKSVKIIVDQLDVDRTLVDLDSDFAKALVISVLWKPCALYAPSSPKSHWNKINRTKWLNFQLAIPENKWHSVN